VPALRHGYRLVGPVPGANQLDSVIPFVITVIVMTYIVRVVKIDATVAGVTKGTAIAAQWLVPIGVIITLLVGGVLSLFHPQPTTAQLPGRESGPGDDSGPSDRETVAPAT
jgi:SSS family solute:Na+ symporter